MNVCVLAGGTGGAKLAAGFYGVLAPGELSVISNTGDDLELWGLLVSPDTDAVLYRLAGIFNETTGWGVDGETFAALDMLRRYGEETWFGLGDRDLATHVLRTSLLADGATLTQATAELTRRLGVTARVIPMSDDPVRTWLATEAGRLSLQDYFIRWRTEPRVHAVELQGAQRAQPSPDAVAAIRGADVVVIAPSNPVVSIAPILSVLGSELARERTVAVTPVVGGRALKGPTVEMLKGLGRDASPEGIARHYRNSAGWFVLDSRDASLGVGIQALGYGLVVTDTVMRDRAGAQRLASSILDAVMVSA